MNSLSAVCNPVSPKHTLGSEILSEDNDLSIPSSATYWQYSINRNNPQVSRERNWQCESFDNTTLHEWRTCFLIYPKLEKDEVRRLISTPYHGITLYGGQIPQLTKQEPTKVFSLPLRFRTDDEISITMIVNDPYISPLDKYKSDSNPMIERAVQTLLQISEYEIFESGMNNRFTELFENNLTKYGVDFLSSFTLHEGFLNDSVQAAIEVIGRIHNENTFAFSYHVLSDYLISPSSTIRDAASSAIADLAGSLAIPILNKTIKCETNDSLKSDMEMLVSDLSG